MSLNEGSTSFATVTSEGYEVTSSRESKEDMEANLAPEGSEPEDPEQEASEAAKKLGSRGGKAAAEKRAAAKTEPEDGDDEEADPSAKEAKADKVGKPRDDPKARMLEATRKEAEAKRQLREEREERARLTQRLEELERRISQPAQPKPAEQPRAKAAASDDDPSDPRPKPDDYDDYDEYVEKKSRWAARQEFKQVARMGQQVQARTAAERQAAETAKAFSERVKSIPEEQRAALKEYAATLLPSHQVKDPSQLSADTDIAEIIFRSENAPALMLHFMEHPEDRQRIAALSDGVSVVREMAKLEARLEAATTATSSRPEVSRAKPPVRSVTGSASTDDGMPSDSDDYETWKRKANALEAKQRRAVAR